MKGDISGLYDEDGIDGPFERGMGATCWCCGKPRSNERCASRCEIVREDVNGGQRPLCLTHDSEGPSVSWASS